MKKLLSLLFILFLTATAVAQDFPGKHYEILRGKKVKAKATTGNYYGFYKKPSLTARLYAEKDNHTPNEALANKVFMVTGFEKNKWGIFFTLNNAEVGTIYYIYRPEKENLFALEMAEDFEFNDNVCSEVVSYTDKFTGELKRHISTDYNVYFSRIGDDIYLALQATASTLQVDKKGVTILLADGSKIKNSEAEIEVKSGEKDYEYQTIFKLTQEDIERLKKSYITDYRLFIFDKSVNSGKILQKLFLCVAAN